MAYHKVEFRFTRFEHILFEKIKVLFWNEHVTTDPEIVFQAVFVVIVCCCECVLFNCKQTQVRKKTTLKHTQIDNKGSFTFLELFYVIQ